MPSEPRKPYWLLPNLLSLDAPLVAVAWLYMFARTWRVDYLPWVAYVSLALVVWIIYVADRLIDCGLKANAARLEKRHEFHCRHKRILWIAVGIASLAALTLVVLNMPMSIYAYSAIGVVFVVAFFMLSVFGQHETDEVPYAKNMIAGAAFAYGTSMLAIVYSGIGLQDLGDSLGLRELLCFTVLCVLNISAIDLWEQAARSRDPEFKAGNELALTLPLTLLGAAALVFATEYQELPRRSFFYAILTGAALLHILNRMRHRFSGEALRVLADVALLLPFVVFIASGRE